MKKIILFAFLSVCCLVVAHAQIISTYAGTVSSGYSGDMGPATSAQLFHPKGAAKDDTGNVYIADADNNVIRKVSPAGIITTVAGLPAGGFSGDGGPAVFALLSRPNSVAIDRRGNMYICDADNQRIRKVNRAGIITTITGDGTAGYMGDGGPATAAEINYPGSIAVDDTGNVYIADEYNNRIRKIDTFGNMSTFAGNGLTGYSGEGGSADAASIGFPFGVAVDHAGNVYFSLTLGNRICRVNTSHIITTVAGTGGSGGFSGDGGPATAADFDTPWGVSVDPSGNLYITDNANQRIREVNMTTGIVNTVAGNGSGGFSGDGFAATAARLQDPAGVYVDAGRNIFIADYNNHRLRKVSTPLTHPPFFVHGHNPAFAVCENVPSSMDTLLNVNDTDAGQYETWSIVSLPAHGSLAATYGTVSSGTIIVPAGLAYTPATSYTGPDSFKVRIYDGTAADTTMVHITVGTCPTELPSVAKNGDDKIYPNPNNGTFTLSLLSAAEEPVKVCITNVVGEKVSEINMVTNKAVQLQLSQPPGIYFIKAISAHAEWKDRILIQRR